MRRTDATSRGLQPTELVGGTASPSALAAPRPHGSRRAGARVDWRCAWVYEDFWMHIVDGAGDTRTDDAAQALVESALVVFDPYPAE